MELPPMVEQFAAIYEQEYGEKIAQKVIRIISYFERLGMALEDLGRDDAKKGRKPLHFSAFYDMTRYVINDDAEEDNCTQIYAELMRDNYMSGYDGKVL